jgi:hypothetical protein
MPHEKLLLAPEAFDWNAASHEDSELARSRKTMQLGLGPAKASKL